jgi:hypothetical protein
MAHREKRGNMEGNNFPDPDSGMFAFDKLNCDGKCCEEAQFFLEQAEDWYLLDNDWHRLVVVVYCPWCGKRLEKA